ncbi:ATP-independent periplasmic protein-refolding chaperone Spy [Symbiopectobacterium purcellii]|uniref:ATP-independent periplasmic protein-refolding chaperone Spy n=1 Tax=Symbiopectobacterium purcellii TaxID=2871826 RepID=A0ABX9AMC2_9ENTR|nr:ATP-independent periplasmic protein-refolding chaperone Spy [Symbiopectobacterium purcellii]QZN96332.1 ATP-independent periplasmic protein-refolding chaperone Spy [Symbiopectobacterium purcellii]
MRKLTAILVASTLAFGAAGIAHANDAQKGHGHEARMMKGERGGPRAGMHEEWMLKDLNLTEAQKKQVGDIIRDARDNMRKVMQDEHRAMRDVIASDTFDMAKAQAQVNKQDAIHKARMVSRLETQNKIYNVLTPEQKKQFNENFDNRINHKMTEPAEKAAAK